MLKAALVAKKIASEIYLILYTEFPMKSTNYEFTRCGRNAARLRIYLVLFVSFNHIRFHAIRRNI